MVWNSVTANASFRDDMSAFNYSVSAEKEESCTASWFCFKQQATTTPIQKLGYHLFEQ